MRWSSPICKTPPKVCCNLLIEDACAIFAFDRLRQTPALIVTIGAVVSCTEFVEKLLEF